MSLLLWTVLGLIAVQIFRNIRGLQRNIAIAKQSGIPYVIVPVYNLNRVWLVQMWLWTPLLAKLPRSWTHPWLELTSPECIWTLGRKPFDDLNSNIFLAVAPGRTICYVADPSAIAQIVVRRADFPKPMELYSSVDIFGKNVVSTEGLVWRHHRKITSPPFTERNNHMVWTESLHQTQAMMNEWVKKGEKVSKPVGDVASSVMRLSLHVISKAGFGRRLYWPQEEIDQFGGRVKPPPGHTMTYKDALSTLLENIIQAFLFPKWFLKHSPIKTNQVTYTALTEWKQYMQEMYDEKKSQVASGADVAGMDLMGALVRGAGVVQPPSSDPEKAPSTGQLLSDTEIFGNAFVFIIAGHETAANVLHFSLVELALNPSSQRRLQSDLDSIFGSREPEQWNYEEDVPRLFGSMAGAVMNEELRVVPPVTSIPKSVTSSSPQSLTLEGKRILLPAGAYLSVHVCAAHMDKRYWPALVPKGSSDEVIEADLKKFKPERWLLDPSIQRIEPEISNSASVQKEDEEGNIGGPQGGDTSSSLFKPAKGAYIPFSEGHRACLGRRFAQVGVLAVLAVLFRKYSVELAVEEILGPQFPFDGKGEIEEVGRKKETGREEWDEASGRVEGMLRDNLATMITLQMRKGRVPLRFVRRGEERFNY